MKITSPNTSADLALLGEKIRLVPDFPLPGILFRDITPILSNFMAMKVAVQAHLDLITTSIGFVARSSQEVFYDIDHICGIESRGFLFGIVLAHELGVGFFPARKPGKLPAATIEQTYALEYGTDRIQIHADAIQPGDNVLIVDDLLASGGTAEAAAKLVEQLGGNVVGIHVFIELVALGGRAKLGNRPVQSVFAV